jgi:hypothetical protein
MHLPPDETMTNQLSEIRHQLEVPGQKKSQDDALVQAPPHNLLGQQFPLNGGIADGSWQR